MALVKLNNRGVRSVSTFGSITALGSMTFIKKLTADGSGDNLTFVDGTSSVVLDNTYKEYIFTFNNMHPATNAVKFQVNFRDGGSAYDATKTTSSFEAYHNEAGSAAAVEYIATTDLAQSTSAQQISDGLGNENDESCSGFLHLFNPSSTTFVKHFLIQANMYNGGNLSVQDFISGYCNTTSAIDGVQFSVTSGNIDAGDICLYGIS